MSETDRKVLQVSGTDAESFLQGLVSNDVVAAEHGPVYAALLTPQGKYIADFFVLKRGEDFLLDVSSPLADSLLMRLSMYKLRADVTLSVSDITVSRGLGPAPAGAHPDPRAPEMGWRGYEGQPGQVVDWDAQRVAACVPLSGIELTPDTFVLEAGFERLNGVDFRKGCYVGQEVTARMKHKTELRKGLATVIVDGAAPTGTDITADGKIAGTLFTQSSGRGIAYLRFDRAKGAMSAGEATITYKA